LPVLTVIYVVSIIFLLCLFFSLCMLAIVFIGATLLTFTSTKVGLNIITNATVILFFPILLPFGYFLNRKINKQNMNDVNNGIVRPMSLEAKYNSSPELREVYKQQHRNPHHLKMFQLFVDQCKRSKEDTIEQWSQGYLSYDKEGHERVKRYLNRAVSSIEYDRNWLIGHYNVNTGAVTGNENKFYLLFPNPLPDFASQYFLEDCYEEGSVLCLVDSKNSIRRKGNFLYNYFSSSFKFYEGQNMEYNFYVPAIEIEFEWNGYKVVPVLKENAKVESVCIEHMRCYKAKSEELEHFHETISQNSFIMRAVKEAHIAVYLIPNAYPEENELFASDVKERTFSHAIKDIPNIDTFAPIYKQDVQERVIQYAKVKKEWAINWLLKDA
ncbi:MAG: hypothetical protein ABS939_17600, partial [Psychrobacillus sp.]